MPDADWSVSYPEITIMSRLESVENEVKQLTAEELRAFRDWFAEFDSAAWDGQFESDVRTGKLDHLAERALRDYNADKATDL
jgi:hypothetical protein